MALNVLIVDDSTFFQRQLKSIINRHADLNVIGIANNGRDAIDKVKKLNPDIVTMDYEMPMMDGITAVRKIMSEHPVPIMMLSSMTYEGARITLDALEAGAVDFMTKNFSEISNNSPAITKRIHESLLAIGNKDSVNPKRTSVEKNIDSIKEADNKFCSRIEEKDYSDSQSANIKISSGIMTGVPKVIVIGASTGGPAALSDLLTKIKPQFNIPIIIVQHMPENFTKAFADRLHKLCKVNVKQAETGDIVKPGWVYIAPGGKQLLFDTQDRTKIKISDGTPDMNYKPSVDITFASLSNSYEKNALAIVLTGMGSDGCKGASLLKKVGATVWTQEKESCLIYGMPMAIDKANLSDASYTVTQFHQKLNDL